MDTAHGLQPFFCSHIPIPAHMGRSVPQNPHGAVKADQIQPMAAQLFPRLLRKIRRIISIQKRLSRLILNQKDQTALRRIKMCIRDRN